jgi:hypothetical protein
MIYLSNVCPEESRQCKIPFHNIVIKNTKYSRREFVFNLIEKTEVSEFFNNLLFGPWEKKPEQIVVLDEQFGSEVSNNVLEAFCRYEGSVKFVL